MGRTAKTLIPILLIILIAVPLVLLYQISQREMKQFELQDDFVFKEFSYGDPEMIQRLDFEESFTLEGQFISSDKTFLDLANNDSLRLIISEGSEVQVGDLIGYSGEEEILAPENALVDAIVLDSDQPYIRFSLLDSPVFQTYLTGPVLDSLTNRDLITEEGLPVSVSFQSAQVINDKREVHLEFESSMYNVGDHSSLRIMTGRQYNGVLAVSSSCVYQKTEGGPHYVRLIDPSEMTVIREAEVVLGLPLGQMVSISGEVEEGEWCDSGYALTFE